MFEGHQRSLPRMTWSSHGLSVVLVGIETTRLRVGLLRQLMVVPLLCPPVVYGVCAKPGAEAPPETWWMQLLHLAQLVGDWKLQLYAQDIAVQWDEEL